MASADSADRAETADRATSADRAETASSADFATTAETATRAQQAASAGTAGTAAFAQAAAAANGVRPVSIDFAAPANTPATKLLDHDGVRISGRCSSTSSAVFVATSTADNGMIRLDILDQEGGATSPLDNLDFDEGAGFQSVTFSTNPADVTTTTVTYRGASSATLTGRVLMAQGAAQAQCIITGTLFAG